MSSILTNNGAMVALQTLKSINSNLLQTQSEISTGKSVASAKDNSALWAISKVMESDVKGFNAISESLSLGESTVAVARQGAETVTDLLTQIKGKVVSSQEENVDREKIQTDIDALTSQIKSVVGAAQFNGLNMLQGTDSVDILSSLDRLSDGSVSASNISISRADLSEGAGTYGTGASLTANSTASAGPIANVGNTEAITFANSADMSGDDFQITIGDSTLNFAAGSFLATDTEELAIDQIAGAINALGLEGVSAARNGSDLEVTSTRAFEDVELAFTGSPVSDGTATIAERSESVTFSAVAKVNAGDGYRVTLGSDVATYIAGEGETFEDVANGLKAAVDSAGIDGITTRVTTNSNGEQVLKIDNDSATAITTFTAVGAQGGEASGGLFGLGNIDVTNNQGAEAALGNVEVLIQNSIDAAAEFGSAQGRIETQSEFVDKLTDSLKSGIGTLVDADMEETSARLQALQVQQQLGVQALSIANQAPQSILSLFR
ncbi:flagellin [uncultured Litoreibacter sp.]|uniref:flagellin N-terminal helical domain-containing protein n=1 Tax=uncultured Litoreibacter sp. TaxID=1392394 RepID=UPI002634A3E1|nr:flagellin [uncultured Litoreibacter sp.]